MKYFVQLKRGRTCKPTAEELKHINDWINNGGFAEMAKNAGKPLSIKEVFKRGRNG